MEAQSQRTVHLKPAEGQTVGRPGTAEELITRKVSAEQTGGAYSLFEVEVGPGSEQAPHIQHREGEFEFIEDGGGSERVGAGSVLYVPKGNLHRYRNTSETNGKLLVIHTPGGSYERFLEEAAEPAGSEGVLSLASKDPSLEAGRIAAIGVKYGIELVPLPPP